MLYYHVLSPVYLFLFLFKLFSKLSVSESWDCSEDVVDLDAFFEVLENLRPDLIIVWGVTRMWNNMPSAGWDEGEAMVIDGYEIKNGWYTLGNRHRVRAIWVYHPSAGYSWDWWNKVIKEVL